MSSSTKKLMVITSREETLLRSILGTKWITTETVPSTFKITCSMTNKKTSCTLKAGFVHLTVYPVRFMTCQTQRSTFLNNPHSIKYKGFSLTDSVEMLSSCRPLSHFDTVHFATDNKNPLVLLYLFTS